MKRQITTLSQKTFAMRATAALILSSLVVSGCAHVVAPENFTSNKSHTPWGPISGSSMHAAESPVLVVNHSTMVKDAQNAFSTGKPLRFGTSIPVSKTAPKNNVGIAANSAPLSASEPANPFNYPAKRLPLPEDLPNLRTIDAAPLPDRFGAATAPDVLKSIHALPETSTQIASNAPAIGGFPAVVAPPAVLPTSAPVTKLPLPEEIIAPRTQIQTKPVAKSTTAVARGRLAEPQTNSAQAIKKTQAEVVPSALSLANETSSDQYGHYKFSFTKEIWLLIFILAGVFATLWFRLEYDFGSRARRRH